MAMLLRIGTKVRTIGLNVSNATASASVRTSAPPVWCPNRCFTIVRHAPRVGGDTGHVSAGDTTVKGQSGAISTDEKP
jgi:hypothetical protein